MSAWHWPQFVYAGLIATGLLTDAYWHGRPRTVTENIWVTLVAAIISVTILHFGGFW